MDAIAVFVKVVEAGSFSVAARRLGMPKTTVSAKVAGLEKRLGVRLIQRTTRKLRMTEAGETYFRHCAIAIREVELGEAALQSTKGRPYGVLKVTAPVEHGTYSSAAHRTGLCSEISGCSHSSSSSRIGSWIWWKKVSTLRYAGLGQLKDSSLIARRFFEARSSLWASPKYMQGFGKPAHPRDLARAAFVRHPAQKSVVLTNGKSDFELQMNGRILADDLGVIKTLIVLGEGIAWLQDFLVADMVEAGKLVRVLSQWRPKQEPWGTCYFVYAGRQYALPKVESFIQTALELVQRDRRTTREHVR